MPSGSTHRSSRGWITGLVLGALLLAGRAGADSAPPLEEVLRAATAIAVGRWEGSDRSQMPGRAIFRVEHVARGELPEVVSLEFGTSGLFASQATLGGTAIVFLKPTSETPPRWRLALGEAGVLPISRDKSVPWVYGNTRLRPCSDSADGTPCRKRLEQLLRDAGLRPLAQPRREATYQVLPRATCEPCELESRLQAQVSPGMKACGDLEQDGPTVLECMREALQARVPFHARQRTVSRDCLDSRVAQAIVFDGTRIHMWSLNSGTRSGAPRCMARLERSLCAAFDWEEGPRRWPECGKPRSFEALCDQTHRLYQLLPPQPVSRLRCTRVPRSDDLRCVEHPATLPGARPPSRQGPNLYCDTPMEGGPLRCHDLD